MYGTEYLKSENTHKVKSFITNPILGPEIQILFGSHDMNGPFLNQITSDQHTGFVYQAIIFKHHGRHLLTRFKSSY